MPDLPCDGCRLKEWVDQKDKSSCGENTKKELKYKINRKINVYTKNLLKYYNSNKLKEGPVVDSSIDNLHIASV